LPFYLVLGKSSWAVLNAYTVIIDGIIGGAYVKWCTELFSDFYWKFMSLVDSVKWVLSGEFMSNLDVFSWPGRLVNLLGNFQSLIEIGGSLRSIGISTGAAALLLFGVPYITPKHIKEALWNTLAPGVVKALVPNWFKRSNWIYKIVALVSQGFLQPIVNILGAVGALSFMPIQKVRKITKTTTAPEGATFWETAAYPEIPEGMVEARIFFENAIKTIDWSLENRPAHEKFDTSTDLENFKLQKLVRILNEHEFVYVSWPEIAERKQELDEEIDICDKFITLLGNLQNEIPFPELQANWEEIRLNGVTKFWNVSKNRKDSDFESLLLKITSLSKKIPLKINKEIFVGVERQIPEVIVEYKKIDISKYEFGPLLVYCTNLRTELATARAVLIAMTEDLEKYEGSLTSTLFHLKSDMKVIKASYMKHSGRQFYQQLSIFPFKTIEDKYESIVSQLKIWRIAATFKKYGWVIFQFAINGLIYFSTEVKTRDQLLSGTTLIGDVTGEAMQNADDSYTNFYNPITGAQMGVWQIFQIIKNLSTKGHMIPLDTYLTRFPKNQWENVIENLGVQNQPGYFTGLTRKG